MALCSERHKNNLNENTIRYVSVCLANVAGARGMGVEQLFALLLLGCFGGRIVHVYVCVCVCFSQCLQCR